MRKAGDHIFESQDICVVLRKKCVDKHTIYCESGPEMIAARQIRRAHMIIVVSYLLDVFRPGFFHSYNGTREAPHPQRTHKLLWYCRLNESVRQIGPLHLTMMPADSNRKKKQNNQICFWNLDKENYTMTFLKSHIKADPAGFINPTPSCPVNEIIIKVIKKKNAWAAGILLPGWKC